MQTIEYRFQDKAAWGDGPWQSEPDKRQWRDEATGLPCLILRNRLGALCGYVGVPRSHPLYRKEYEEAGEALTIHGGLTFSDSCSGDEEAKSVCHKVEPGEPDEVWWLGFDCAHLFDMSPAYEARSPAYEARTSFEPAIYRDFAYVTQQCESLAKQLSAMGAKEGAG